MSIGDIKLHVVFFRTETGAEPVRRWLKAMPDKDKKAIGEDIKTVQFGWPLGMPLVEKLEQGLWEVRTRLPNGIARILFTVNGGMMIRFTVSSRRAERFRNRNWIQPDSD